MRFSPQVAGAGVAGIIAAAGLCIAPGCGGPREAAVVNTGLARLAEGDPDAPAVTPPDPLEMTPAQAELYRLAEESAANLQAVFDQMNQRATTAQPPVPQPSPSLAEAAREPRQAEPAPEQLAALDPGARSPQPSPFEDPSFAEPAAVAVAEASEPGEPSALPRESLRPVPDRIHDHTIVLVDLLRQQSITQEAPFRSYLALAAMEVMWPGALQKVITPDASSSGANGQLTPDQLAAIEAFREFAVGLSALPKQPSSPIDGVVELAERLIAARPMRIHNAALCSRVSGFGQYIPLGSTRFLHGRNHPVIIYTEVWPFAHRPATSSEAARAFGSTVADSSHKFWSVELSQEVQVFHDSDGLLVWSRPEQAVLETSRNKRRDFFLVNEIALPRTLSVGRYQMKIIMRDKTSGSVDEAIMPFEVVADPALARGLSE